MVVKRGNVGYRSFTLVSANKLGGCSTKGKGGRFINKTPAGAARKAFTDLCRTKNIRGICTLFVTMMETTSGSNKKMFSYKLQRNKLKKPIVRFPNSDKEYVIEYKSTIQSTNVPSSCKLTKGSVQTPGRKKKRTAKKTKLTGNNVRKMANNSKKNNNGKGNSVKPLRRSKRLAKKKSRIMNRLSNMF